MTSPEDHLWPGNRKVGGSTAELSLAQVGCASRTAAKYRNTTAATCYEAGLTGGLPC
jgi:hypothetical protein